MERIRLLVDFGSISTGDELVIRSLLYRIDLEITQLVYVRDCNEQNQIKVNFFNEESLNNKQSCIVFMKDHSIIVNTLDDFITKKAFTLDFQQLNFNSFITN